MLICGRVNIGIKAYWVSVGLARLRLWLGLLTQSVGGYGIILVWFKKDDI